MMATLLVVIFSRDYMYRKYNISSFLTDETVGFIFLDMV